MTNSSTQAKSATEAKPAAGAAQTNAQAAPPTGPTLASKIIGSVKKLLGGS